MSVVLSTEFFPVTSLLHDHFVTLTTTDALLKSDFSEKISKNLFHISEALIFKQTIFSAKFSFHKNFEAFQCPPAVFLFSKSHFELLQYKHPQVVLFNVDQFICFLACQASKLALSFFSQEMGKKTAKSVSCTSEEDTRTYISIYLFTGV